MARLLTYEHVIITADSCTLELVFLSTWVQLFHSPPSASQSASVLQSGFAVTHRFSSHLVHNNAYNNKITKYYISDSDCD